MPRFWTLHRSTRWTTSREALHSYLTKSSSTGIVLWGKDLGPQLTVKTWSEGIITSHPSVRVNCLWSTPCGPLFRRCLFLWQRAKPAPPACTTYFMIFPSDWQSWTSRWSFMTTANRRRYRIYSTKVCRLIVTERHLNDIHSFILKPALSVRVKSVFMLFCVWKYIKHVPSKATQLSFQHYFSLLLCSNSGKGRPFW